MIRILLTALVVIVFAGSVWAEEKPPSRPYDSTYVKALMQMVRPEVADSTLSVRSLHVENHSFKLTIDSAEIQIFPFIFAGIVPIVSFV